MALLCAYADRAVANGTMIQQHAENIKGVAKNVVYLVALARMHGGDGGDGVREVPGQGGYATQPAILRLVGRAGR
jgi:hypothetical protein